MESKENTPPVETPEKETFVIKAPLPIEEPHLVALIEVSYDCKNREVMLRYDSEKDLFFITKEATGYHSKGFKKISNAKKAFDFQIACSQNQ